MSATPSFNLAELTTQELLARYSRTPTDKTVQDEIYRRCIARMDHVIRMYAFHRSLPLIRDRKSFIIEAGTRAASMLAKRGFRFIQSAKELDKMLTLLARTSALQEYRVLRRRAAGVTWQEAPGREFRSKHHRTYERDAVGSLRNLDEGITNAALTIHAESNPESAYIVRIKLEEEWTVGQIALERGSAKSDVWAILEHDAGELQRIVEEEFGIPVERLSEG